MTTISSNISRAARLAARLTAPAAIVLTLAGCELDAVNPGPIQADQLNNASAIPPLVNGAGRDLAEALNWVSYTSAAVALELFPGGSTGSFGITPRQQIGKLADDDGDDWWNLSQRARWTAEDAVARAKTLLGNGVNNVSLTQGMIWAGYANRLLGENFCDGVINGGAPGPSSVYFERAEGYFTEAIAMATALNNATLRDAATAGRASVRLSRGNLTGAATDAGAITNNAFAYRMSYFGTELDQYNRIYWAGANQPYRAHTVWNTRYETIRKTTRDARIPFDSSLTILVGDAAVGNLGRVRWYFQTKYNAQAAPINLSTGWEMRLIEAEVKLINNDIAGAMTSINLRRTNLGLPALTATTAAEAWTHLKSERGLELWIEARRLGDFRRWAAANRPGTAENMAGRDLCFATPLSEKQTNPNF